MMVLRQARRKLRRDFQCPPSDLLQDIADISVKASAVAHWAIANGLHLNVNKIKERIDYASLHPVQLFDCTLPFEHTVKSLGIIIYPLLDWDDHVLTVLK